MTRSTEAPATLALRHALRLLGVVAALALCVSAAQAQKQVYRCKTSAGQVNLSDKPCADSSSEQVVYSAEPAASR